MSASPRAAALGVQVDAGVARLVLDRPDAGNRIDTPLAVALRDAAESLALEDDVRVVVIAASGPHFCLGSESGTDPGLLSAAIAAVGRLMPPVVVAVHGDAVAEGLELALACDLRVASERAHFAMPQVSEGRLPRSGGTQRLPRCVGRMRALDLMLTGRSVDAAEAAAIGLVSRLLSQADFSAGVAALVEVLRCKAPIALRYAKEAISKGSDMTLDQGIRLEEDLYVLLQTTADRREGVSAFLSKRKPVFHGQ